MRLPRLLITGSKGKIGTILMEGLAGSFEIYRVNILETEGKRSFRADIANYEQIFNLLRVIAPLPCIVHLAADPRVGAGWDSVLKNNMIGTKNLYEVVKEYEVKKMVFASSTHVTGAYEGIPPTLHEQPKPRLITIDDPVRFLGRRLRGSTTSSMEYVQCVLGLVAFWPMTILQEVKESAELG